MGYVSGQVIKGILRDKGGGGVLYLTTSLYLCVFTLQSCNSFLAKHIGGGLMMPHGIVNPPPCIYGYWLF